MTPDQKLATPEELAYAIMVKSSEDAETSKRMTKEQALEIAHIVLQRFGFSTRIIDNVLEPEERDAFYMLEEYRLLKTDREETILYDGKEWRTFYWDKRDDYIKRIAKTPSTRKIKKELIYNSLPDEFWTQRSLESEVIV